MMRQVFLINNEITFRIISVEDTPANAGDYGQLIINDLPSMTADNRDGFWDTNNPASPFFNGRLDKFNVEIFNNGQRTFQGTIQSIEADNANRTAKIVLRSDLQKALEQGIVYASADEATPADMVKEICSLYKIPIDSASFARSNAVYSIDKIVTSAFFQGETTVLDAIQQIAEIGIASVYSVDGRLHFETYQQRSSPPVATFSDLPEDQITIWKHPQINPVEKSTIEGYSVEWVGGQGAPKKAVRGTEDQQGKSISGGYGNPVRIMSFQSAVWIGEQWFEYLNYSQRRINFDIPVELGRSMSLFWPVEVKYRGQTYRGDVVKIGSSSRLKANVEILTR
jgi:hypothetical protein